jgi:hypothetical protein
MKFDTNKNRFNLLVFCAFIIYSALTFFTVLNHEYGRDETAPWLIVRDVDFFQVFAELQYQVHPCLWYLLLAPFAKIGFPCETIGILNWLATLGVAYLLIWRSPLPEITTLLCIFSYYLFWQYAIDARGIYAIGLLVLFFIAYFYPKRFSNPLWFGILLFLLFNSNVTMFPPAGALLLVWVLQSLVETKLNTKTLSGMLIAGVGFLIAIWQVGLIFPPSDLPLIGRTDGVGFQPESLIKALCGAFFAGLNPVPMLAIPALVMVSVLLYSLASRPFSLLFCCTHIVGNLCVIGLKPIYTSERHYGIILMGIIFALWIAHYEEDRDLGYIGKNITTFFSKNFKSAVLALNISFIASMGFGFLMHYYEWNFLFSGCSEMASFIKKNNLEKVPIASHRYGHLTPIAAYLPGKKFWYAGIGKDATFVHLDYEHVHVGHVMPYDRALQKIDEHFPPNEEILILLDTKINNAEGSKYQLLHKVDENVFGSDERCYLYRRTKVSP